MIDAEISSLQGSLDSRDVADPASTGKAPSEEMVAAASRVFGNEQDPRFDKRLVDEILQFAAAEGEMESPGDLLRFVASLEKVSTLGNNHSSLARSWHAMKEIQFHRATQDLQSLQ
jgi:hypothetical protein